MRRLRSFVEVRETLNATYATAQSLDPGGCVRLEEVRGTAEEAARPNAQDEETVEELLAAAAAALPVFEAALREMAEGLASGATVRPGPLKQRSRIDEKIANECYDKEPPFARHIKDCVRGSVVVETPEAVVEAIEAIRAGFVVLRIKNRFQEPTRGRAARGGRRFLSPLDDDDDDDDAGS